MSAAVVNPGSVDSMPQQQPGNGAGLPPTPSRAHTSLSTPTIRDSPNMTTPGMSRDKDQETVMGKYFGVSVEQMKRTQALLRLGVTEEDLRVAERLFAVLPGNEELVSKEERLLGLTRSEISFYKALEVLGVDMSLVEDERARRLGSLGIGGRPHTTKAKSTPSIDEASAGMSCFFPRHGHHHTNSTEASARAAPSTQALAVDAMLEAAAEGARMRSLQALCAQQEMVIRSQAAQITELKRIIAAGSLPLPPGHSAQQASAEPPAPPSSDLSGTATVQGGQQSKTDVTARAGADMETAMP